MTLSSGVITSSDQCSDFGLRSAHLKLMGGFLLTINGVLVTFSPSSQRLVAFLALESRPVSRKYIISHLYPDTIETRAAGNLRSTLWRIHRKQPSMIVCYGDYLALASNIMVDVSDIVNVARRLANQNTMQLTSDLDPNRFQGELLPDWYDDWIMLERERLRQICLHTLEIIASSLSRMGRYAQAVDAALMVVAADPFRESAHLILIQTYLLEGNQPQAIQHYKYFSDLLDRELQIAPSQKLQDLVLANGAK